MTLTLRPLAALLLLAGGLVTFARADTLTRDLGEGLTYHRARTLPGDLPVATAAAKKQPCVLDLRYAHGDATAAGTLDAWLKFNAAARTPVFLLVNADTDSTLLTPLAGRLPATGVVVIGSATTALPPDLVLKISAEDERRAYEALGAGVTIDSLLNDSPEKIRNDEARLAKERQTPPDTAPLPSDDPLDDLLPGAEKPGPDKTAAKAKSRPVIDVALQRAVQLHRSLKALKRL
jgi:hypothetical protein